LESNSIHISDPSLLYAREMFSFVLVGDKGFSLTEKLLIPYPGP